MNWLCLFCLRGGWVVPGVISRGKVTSYQGFAHEMCLRTLCKAPCVVLWAQEMHSIAVTRWGITDGINGRTVTARVALETPRCHQGKGKHTIFGLGHFQTLLKPGSCTRLCAHERFGKGVWGKGMEQKGWELALRAGWQKWGNSNSFLNHSEVALGLAQTGAWNGETVTGLCYSSRLSRSRSEKVLIEGSNYLVIKGCCCIR